MRSRITIISLVLIVFTILSVPSQKREKIKHLGTGSITTIAYSPDGTQIAVGSSNGIWIYDVHTGEDLRRFAQREDINGYLIAMKFSADGKTLAGVSNTTMWVWDVKNGTRIRTTRLSSSTTADYGAAFSPDGKMLASTDEEDEIIRLWDVKSGKHIHILTGDGVEPFQVAFSPDGKMLASGDWRSKIILWDVRSGSHRRTLTGMTDMVGSLAFSPDGKTLASGCYNGTVVLWENFSRH